MGLTRLRGTSNGYLLISKVIILKKCGQAYPHLSPPKGKTLNDVPLVKCGEMMSTELRFDLPKSCKASVSRWIIMYPTMTM